MSNFNISCCLEDVPLAAWKANGTLTTDAGSGKTCPWPTHVQGDYALLIALQYAHYSAAVDEVLDVPAGFTLVGTSDSVVGGGSVVHVRTTVWWCYATSSAMASPVIASSGVYAACSTGQIITFANCMNAAPIDSVAGPQTTGYAFIQQVIPSIDVTNQNDLIVLVTCAFMASLNSATYFRNTTFDLTKRADGQVLSVANGGQRLLTAVATGKRTTPGESGTTNVQHLGGYIPHWSGYALLLQSVGNTFDIQAGYPQYPWYPMNADEAHYACGDYGTFTQAWLMDTAGIDQVPVFGDLTLTYGSATFSSGPLGGLDQAIQCDLSSLSSYSEIGITSMMVSSANDLIIVVVFKAEDPTGTSILVAYDDQGGTHGFRLELLAATELTFVVSDGTDSATSSTSTEPGKWMVAVAVLDRGAGVVRVACESFDYIASIGSTSSTAAVGSLFDIESPADVYVGGASIEADYVQISALYVGIGAGIADGMSTNLAAITDNFLRYIKTGGHFEVVGKPSPRQTLRTAMTEGWTPQ